LKLERINKSQKTTVKKYKLFIPFIIASVIISFQLAFSTDERLKPRVALVPLVNEGDDEQIDLLNETIDDTVMLNLERIRMFLVAKSEVMDPYKDFSKVREYADESRTDNIIYGKTFYNKKEEIVIEMSVYDKVKKRTVITKQAKAENIFEIFDAANELIVSLVKEFAGMHVGFGAFEFFPSQEEGDYDVYIDGDYVGKNITFIRDVLNGIRYVEVRQNRMLGEEVIYRGDNWVYEDQVTDVDFNIPYLIKEEATVLTILESTIAQLRRDRRQVDKVRDTYDKVISLFEDVSYCRRLTEEKDRFRQMQAEYRLREIRWRLEDSFYEPDLAIFDEIVGVYESADSYIDPLTIKEMAIDNANFLYNILGVHAAYHFSQADWLLGLKKYEQIESMSSAIPAVAYYDLPSEHGYINHVWENYLEKSEQSSVFAELGIGFRINNYLKSKVEDSLRIFKRRDKIKERELIVLTNPSGLKVYVNDKYYGNSPLRVQKLSDKMVNVLVQDPWSLQESTFVNLRENRNFLFIKTSLAREIALHPPVVNGQKRYRLSWEELQDAESYILQIDKKEGNFVRPVFEDYGIKETFYELKEELEEGEVFLYRVQGVNKNDIKSGWSYSDEFIGRVQWSFETGNDVSSPPAIGNDGSVYFGSEDRALYALAPEGTLKWIFPTGGRIRSSPKIGSDGTIYFGSEDWNLYALDPDGQLKWVFSTADRVRKSPALGSSGTVYVVSEDDNLYALDPDGRLKWTYAPGSRISSSPVAGRDGNVYFVGEEGILYSLGRDGHLQWMFAAGSRISSTPVVGLDGSIYFGSDDRTLYALGPDGKQKWGFATGQMIKASPAIGPDGTVYFGSKDRCLYALNGDGNLKWIFPVENSIETPPAVGFGDIIYLTSGRKRFYAINKDGELDWTYLFRDDAITSPITSPDGSIYIGIDDSRLYKLLTGLL
jgi:outer membrane protein assembly factor BamB/TolB-like protein